MKRECDAESKRLWDDLREAHGITPPAKNKHTPRSPLDRGDKTDDCCGIFRALASSSFPFMQIVTPCGDIVLRKISVCPTRGQALRRDA